jgi:hypothetical protein
MNRFILLTVCSVAFSLGAISQEVPRSAVTSGGGNYVSAGSNISVSFGQLAVQSYQNGNRVLTLGFQQPRGLCAGDLNQDGAVNTEDLLAFLSQYGCVGDCIGDFDNSGGVNTLDLLSFLSYFQNPCVF